MSFKVDIFLSDIKKTSEGNFIHFVNIPDIDAKLQTLIEENITSIWDGDFGTPIGVVKTEIFNFIKTKSDDIKKGAIAEFIIHLYLKACGFSQECLFKNLEEGSIKKGFDGYYSFSNEEWIMESKSGSIDTNQISHKKKIKEAYDDLKNKIEGKGSNNPWSNAYNHAIAAGTSTDIIKNIKKLSINYVRETFPDISTLNIIASSTIYHNGNWDENLVKPDHDTISKMSESFNYQKINIICVNKKSIDTLIEHMTQ
jgi:hypothetical protein